MCGTDLRIEESGRVFDIALDLGISIFTYPVIDLRLGKYKTVIPEHDVIDGLEILLRCTKSLDVVIDIIPEMFLDAHLTHKLLDSVVVGFLIIDPQVRMSALIKPHDLLTDGRTLVVEFLTKMRKREDVLSAV